jgi:hypothetical protein
VVACLVNVSWRYKNAGSSLPCWEVCPQVLGFFLMALISETISSWAPRLYRFFGSNFKFSKSFCSAICSQLSLLFCSTGIWTWGFALTRQVLCCLSHRFRPFCSGDFGDRVFLFAQASLNCGFPYFMLLANTGMTGAHHHAQPPLRWCLTNFFTRAGLEPCSSQVQLLKWLGLHLWAISV